MTRIVVLGAGFAGLETIRCLDTAVRRSGYWAWLFWNALHLWKLVGFRKQLQVALDWSLARHFPRDSAIMRPPPRCPICAHARARERQAA
ncbi:MAG: hypothetical protein HYR51_06925 [Candidatus Rokubacteria bacterium]|nr:hypothetical protein [Candidatus Rokubacteria bacterium]